MTFIYLFIYFKIFSKFLMKLSLQVLQQQREEFDLLQELLEQYGCRNKGCLPQETNSVGMSGNWKGGDKFPNTWKKWYMPSLEKYSGSQRKEV